MSTRRRPNFLTRTAEEDAVRLDPGEPGRQESTSEGPLEPSAPPERASTTPATAQRPSHIRDLPKWWSGTTGELDAGQSSQQNPASALVHMPLSKSPLSGASNDKKDKNGHRSRTAEESKKLGTFSGVFVPTTLNVLSILMFLRFGFILGQAGLLGILGLLVVSYLINLVTTMSLSAIATNGTVRGGGAYYLISRSLGPEFGGSIGIVFYLGYVFNTGMNAVGLIDCLTQNFGVVSGALSNFLAEGFWWQYLWGTVVLVLCTAICLAGSSIFAKASNGLLVILLIATFSIPLSAIFMKPFHSVKDGVEFTGLSMQTLMGNLKPRLTKNAAGSQLRGKETFQDLFGILFPATGGIFAGASMSGDLRNPSQAIPKGTLAGLALTFVTYALVVGAMAASITRESLYNNVNVIQIVNFSDTIILLGEFATTFFSALMGVIGSAKLLQAIARDSLLPGLNLFGQGTKKSDDPIYAIIVTFIFAQITMLFDINRIASFITMAYLMTFLVMNLACFLLKIGSAPNFRPSFRYFNWQTAAAGTLVSGMSMFFVDGLYAAGCVGILIVIFLFIHYSCPPKPWGDVSQSLIYHQVRKYLLRLRPEHVKFWRPQILLFVSDLDRQYKMVSFCNSLKKGALFVLGHVIVTEDFSSAVPEARRQQTTWTKLVEYSKIKAFVNVAVAPAAEWGMRNIVLSSGLGGMRPNIVVIDQFREDHSLVETFSASSKSRRRSSAFPREPDDATTAALPEKPMSIQSYVTILEDLLFKLRINVAVAKGFEELELPDRNGHHTKKYIDLWPIQMSAELGADSESKQNVTTTNFDTYTLILQLGCILNTVPSWKKTYQLRVAVFVEYETDVEEERARVEALLEKLRIQAEVLVFWLACGDVKSYRIIVNGDTSPEVEDAQEKVQSVLGAEEWWQGALQARNNYGDLDETGNVDIRPSGQTPAGAPESGESEGKSLSSRVSGLRKLIESTRRRRSVSSFRAMGGLNLGMQTHRLLDAFVDYDGDDSSSESSADSDLDSYVSEPEDEAAPVPKDGLRPDFAFTRNSARTRSADRSSGISPKTRSQPQPSFSGEQGSIPTSAAESTIPKIVAEEASPKTKSPASLSNLPSQSNRPSMSRSASSNRFSSSPIPEAKVNTEDDAGPSIMFESSASPRVSTSLTQSMLEDLAPRRPLAAVRPIVKRQAFRAQLLFLFHSTTCRAGLSISS
ncbi:hypothetical protein N7468_006631 [Penicillium chermesinum]|uniref:Cation chloride cotransporter n=1 Tax=Penicillium chermesinum TaxID=63820 RepID=A0A9W9NSL5_9EURO|nr:uncharacterized protein N7468_006631 [Penicillium chermesinum]KAJ5225406.1 hypothetical protein N7468_006631 [Penicillium chermesinum]